MSVIETVITIAVNVDDSCSKKAGNVSGSSLPIHRVNRIFVNLIFTASKCIYPGRNQKEDSREQVGHVLNPKQRNETMETKEQNEAAEAS